MQRVKKFCALICVMMSLAIVPAVEVLGADFDVNDWKLEGEICIKGKYSYDKMKPYRKIIKSYKQLKKTKKYLKKNFKNPKKYLKMLKKYDKKYFKENAIILVTENVDMKTTKYEFSSLEKEDNKLVVNVDKTLVNILTTTEIQYYANTYLIGVKKSKIKDVKKVKVVYRDVEEVIDEESRYEKKNNLAFDTCGNISDINDGKLYYF